MRFLKPVIWSKGMPLTPQHLQAHDRYLEDLLQFHMEAFSPRGWGFTSLQVTPRAASVGRSVALSAASGILPDGTVFSMPDPDPLPPPLALRPGVMDRAGEVIDIHLALAPVREKEKNVAFDAAAADTRYVATTVQVRDELDPRFPSPIILGNKNFRLVTGAELGPGDISLQVARLRSGAGESLSVDPAFMPPMLLTSASAGLIGMTREILEKVLARIAEISENRKQRSDQLVEYRSADAGHFWLLQALNSHFPALRHYCEGAPDRPDRLLNPAHPEELFHTLISLAGALLAHSRQHSLSELPVYDHARPGECFGQLYTLLNRLLEIQQTRDFLSVRLTSTDYQTYSAEIPGTEWLDSREAYLSVQSPALEPGALATRVPAVVRLTGRSRAHLIGAFGVSGISMEYRNRQQVPLFVPPGASYFRLQLDGGASAEWDEVRNRRGIEARFSDPNSIPSPVLELYIALPARSASTAAPQ